MSPLISILFFSLSLLSPVFGQDDLPQFKPAPTRPSEEADVVIDWQETLDECFEGKICIQGQLHNQGKKPAKGVKINVEIGGTKHTKPRIVLSEKVEQSDMNPGDRQDFDLRIDRKVAYKDKNEEKTIEVGKYNFKIVPTWNGPEVKKLSINKISKPKSSLPKKSLK